MITESAINEIELLSRHLLVLRYVMENEPIGSIKLAQKAGIPLHKVRYSLSVLEREGLVTPTNPGTMTTEKTRQFLNDVGTIIRELANKVDGLNEIQSQITASTETRLRSATQPFRWGN
jgi:predicted transcriptional regulator